MQTAVEETPTKPSGHNQIAAQNGFQNSSSKRRVLMSLERRTFAIPLSLFLNLMTLRCPFGSHYSLSHSLSRLVFASGAQFSLRVQFLQSRQGLVSKMKGSPVAQHSPTIGSIGSSSQPLIGGLSSGANGNQARATPVDHVGSILWGANCCISQPFIWHLSTCQPSAASASSCDQN